MNCFVLIISRDIIIRIFIFMIFLSLKVIAWSYICLFLSTNVCFAFHLFFFNNLLSDMEQTNVVSNTSFLNNNWKMSKVDYSLKNTTGGLEVPHRLTLRIKEKPILIRYSMHANWKPFLKLSFYSKKSITSYKIHLV